MYYLILLAINKITNLKASLLKKNNTENIT